MRKNFVAYGLLVTIISVLSFSCTKDTVTEHYSFYRPVYEGVEAVKAAIKSAEPLPIAEPGKFVIKDSYIYLSELYKGVHIIDYRNPRAPLNIGFVAIPGVVDIAVRDHYLYADCYRSLVVVDIIRPDQVSLTNFINDVFPDRFSGLASDPTRVIKSWTKVDTTITYRFDREFDKTLERQVMLSDAYNSAASSGGGKAGNSTGGSLARFALDNDRLYTVGTSYLRVFNTSNAASPQYIKQQPLGSGIETIFPYKQKLFIGSQTGMFIFSISDKDNPTFLSAFQHARVCDPVVADDTHAYVTLRNGSQCAGFLNQLDVLDIADLTKPIKINTYQLKNPRGLSKDGNLLFICDGTDGVKIFDASKPADLKSIKTVGGIEANDIIAQQGIAIVMTSNGLSFIDYHNPAEASIVSGINLAK